MYLINIYIIIISGLMICAYLLFYGVFETSKEVLNHYAGKRTFDSIGVTVPSQRRYMDYISTKTICGLEYLPTRLMPEALILSRCLMLASAITNFISSFLSSNTSMLSSSLKSTPSVGTIARLCSG